MKVEIYGLYPELVGAPDIEEILWQLISTAKEA